MCGHSKGSHFGYVGLCDQFEYCRCTTYQSSDILIFIMGPPCAGKTTIANRLADMTGYRCLSGGDVARKLAISDVDVRNALARGKIAPENLMNEQMCVELKAENQPLIIEGYPRYWEQMADVLRLLGQRTCYFINVEAPPSILTDRNFSRKRGDNQVHHERYSFFLKRTKPVIEWLRSKKLCFDIDNGGEIISTITPISSRIIQHIKGTP